MLELFGLQAPYIHLLGAHLGGFQCQGHEICISEGSLDDRLARHHFRIQSNSLK